MLGLIIAFIYLIVAGNYSKIIVYGEQNFRFQLQGQDMFELNDLDLNYEFVGVKNEETSKKGVQTPKQSVPSCCSLVSEYGLEALCISNRSKARSTLHCTCTDYIMCKLVVVTALSSDQFTDSKRYFRSIGSNLPNTNVIVYDLGLTDD